MRRRERRDSPELPPDPVVQPFADWAVGGSVSAKAHCKAMGRVGRGREESGCMARRKCSRSANRRDKQGTPPVFDESVSSDDHLLAALPTKAKGRSSSYPEVAPELIAPNRLTKLFCDPPHPWAMVWKVRIRWHSSNGAGSKAVRETNRRLDWLLSSYKHVVIERGGGQTVRQR